METTVEDRLKVAGSPISYGSRTNIYRMLGDDTRVVRAPKDPKNDSSEQRELAILKATINPDYFPNPRVEPVEVEGIERALITCDYIDSPLLKKVPTPHYFRNHLDAALTDLEDKVDYIKKLRTFIDQVRELYLTTNTIPDLVGRGNLVPYENSVMLLDFNNAGFEPAEFRPGVIHVAIDANGLPIFDLGLRLMYNIEKGVLSTSKKNYSTQGFTEYLSKLSRRKKNNVTKELRSVLKPREVLKQDHFYGALRFKARREKVDRIMAGLDAKE